MLRVKSPAARYPRDYTYFAHQTPQPDTLGKDGHQEVNKCLALSFESEILAPVCPKSAVNGRPLPAARPPPWDQRTITMIAASGVPNL
jgi:hypothetical protein